MGSNPHFAIVHSGDIVPYGYFLVTDRIVEQYEEEIYQMHWTLDQNGWSIIGYYGGQIKGPAYATYEGGVTSEGGYGHLIESVPNEDEPYYFVDNNPDVNDILIVKADPNNGFIPGDCHLGNGNMC